MQKITPTKARNLSATGLLAAFFLIIVVGCATTAPRQGEPLAGILVQGAGDQVALAWSADSPLARSFRQSESVSIVASYQSAGGLVSGERVANSQVDNSRNLAVFTLPSELRNRPEGPVCLRIAKGGRQSIPLRVASPGKTTDAFRYEPWERVVKVGTSRRTFEVELREAELNVSRLEQSANELSEWRAKRGVNSRDQCGSIEADFSVSRPAGAVAAEQRDVESRKQCVSQFGFLVSGITAEARPGLSANELATEIANHLVGEPDQVSGQRLKNDVSRFGSALGPDYKRRLNTYRLGITSSTMMSLRFSEGRFDNTTAASVVGAYDVCLDEARDQFRQAYDAWQAESQLPVGAQRTQVLQAECNRVFENEARVNTQIAEFETSRDGIRRELAALPLTADLSLPENIVLTAIDCSNESR